MMKISNIQRIHEIANFKNHILGMAKEKSTYVRYAVRYKRADAKKALKDLLDGKPSYNICQDDDNHQHSKNSGRSKPQKSHSMKGKRSKYWSKKNCCSDEDEHEQSSAIFTSNFGRWRSFTWSFNTWESSNCQNNTNGFQWKDDTKSDKHRGRIWSESDLEEEENDIDLHSDRIALGLPASGHLCLDDVKRAFRESALKWHPDKHQGVAQAVAAEKFKLCVDAYKKLCNALRPP